MTDRPAGPDIPDPSSSSAGPPDAEPPAAPEPGSGSGSGAGGFTRPADPERGLRGAMAGILVLETIVILLGIPVAENTGPGTGPVGVVLICALAAAHLAACAVVSRRPAVPVILVLQALLISCWAINASIGVMGIVFTLVWLAVLWMRHEFRRRVAAGLIPGQTGPPAADGPTGGRGR